MEVTTDKITPLKKDKQAQKKRMFQTAFGPRGRTWCLMRSCRRRAVGDSRTKGREVNPSWPARVRQSLCVQSSECVHLALSGHRGDSTAPTTHGRASLEHAGVRRGFGLWLVLTELRKHACAL